MSINWLIPVKVVQQQSGRFHLPDTLTLAAVRSDDLFSLQQLGADLKKMHLPSIIIRDVISAATVRIIRDPQVNSDQGYQLHITSEGIRILASTAAGAFYGIQTLRELLTLYQRRLPCCLIRDEPDFPRRGLYLDCSRGKVPKLSTLKSLVEYLARWKINELQLYIENVFTFSRHPDIGKGYSPFTPKELLELDDHCRRHHIRLVGSLASFGHMEKILALPDYHHLSEMADIPHQSVGSTLCPIDPRSEQFLRDLYEEFVPLFSAEDFNVCGDETWELGKGRSRSRAEKIGTGMLYLEFLKKLKNLCDHFGKRMNAWSDIVLSYPDVIDHVPRDIVLLNWDYEIGDPRMKQTPLLAQAGLPFLVCPGTSAWLTHGTRLGNAIANVAEFTRVGRRCHAQGVLNTDWGDHGHRNTLGVSLHGYAHAGAHAWHGLGVNDDTFTQTFCRHVFHQKKNDLARALRTLGSSWKIARSLRNESALYHALVESLPGGDLNPSRIDATPPAAARQIIANLDRVKSAWPAPDPDMDQFLALALEEYRLAARMDRLACRRILLAQQIRCQKPVSDRELTEHAGCFQALRRDFEHLWRRRNKPSRLRDNLKLFTRAEQQALQLARKNSS